MFGRLFLFGTNFVLLIANLVRLDQPDPLVRLVKLDKLDY